MHLHQKDQHVPVLLEPVLEYLQPKQGESYLDLTAGYGGHAGAILERTGRPDEAVLVDRDANAISALAAFAAHGARLMHTDFLTASRQLQEEGKQFDLILADLGVSSPHLDQADRGFAFSQNGPLDMRMDQRNPLTAEEIVNTYDFDELVRIFREYGEEPRAKRIAETIIGKRPFSGTQELAEAIRVVMPKGGKIHPATRAFQALRIAVNDELELLRQSLPIWFDLLRSGGRIGIISFHSLEDRIVKQATAEVAGNRYDASLQLQTKKPITAAPTELASNPRARSAKLRVAAKK